MAARTAATSGVSDRDEAARPGRRPRETGSCWRLTMCSGLPWLSLSEPASITPPASTPPVLPCMGHGRAADMACAEGRCALGHGGVRPCGAAADLGGHDLHAGQGARPGDRPAAVLDHRRGGASLGGCAPLRAAAFEAAASTPCKNDQAAGRPICARGFVRGGSHERVSGPVAATAGPKPMQGPVAGIRTDHLVLLSVPIIAGAIPPVQKVNILAPKGHHSPFPLPRADERETGRHG